MMNPNVWLFVALALLAIFNISGFALLWLEVRGQRQSTHHLRGQLQGLYVGHTEVLLDHESRVSRMEGSPFKPAAVYDKLGGDFEELVKKYLREKGVPA